LTPKDFEEAPYTPQANVNNMRVETHRTVVRSSSIIQLDKSWLRQLFDVTVGADGESKIITCGVQSEARVDGDNLIIIPFRNGP